MFVECFRQGVVVQVAGAGRVPAFRAFLYGVIRNVARRFESRPGRTPGPLPDSAADAVSQSRLFDRTWAQAIMAAAARLQQQRATAGNPAAVQRVEENLPIRAIAKRWGTEAARLHHAQALARQEFAGALPHPGSPAAVEREAARKNPPRPVNVEPAFPCRGVEA